MISRFLYTIFIAIDANFKLKSKDRGIKDFQLDPGWGCFVETSRYEAHISAHVDDPEVIQNETNIGCSLTRRSHR